MRLLKFALTRLRSERSQALILAALAMVVPPGLRSPVDRRGLLVLPEAGGPEGRGRRRSRRRTGAPGRLRGGWSKAREYLAKNGVTDEDTITVTFRSPARIRLPAIPPPASGTLRGRSGAVGRGLVRESLRHPGGADKGRARRRMSGICGGSPFQPVDVIQIMDRTGSMTPKTWRTPRTGPGRCWSTSMATSSGLGWRCEGAQHFLGESLWFGAARRVSTGAPE